MLFCGIPDILEWIFVYIVVSLPVPGTGMLANHARTHYEVEEG